MHMILKWSTWTATRKAQASALSIGGLVPLALIAISHAHRWGDAATWLCLYAGILVLLPAFVFCRAWGLPYATESTIDPSRAAGNIALLILTNAVIYLLFGTLIGWFMDGSSKARKRRGK